MTSKVGKQAPFLAGIPVVASTAERDSLYPSPDTNQRVQNLGSGYFERWNGATWVQDIATGVGAGGVYSVKSYGAIGDGDTDDTTACQNALNAADLAGVGAVVVPPGTYKLTAALTPGSGTTFLGQGGFLRQHTEAANVVTVASKSNVALVNLDVGYNTSTVRNTTNGLSVQTCTDVEISGCRVRNGPGLGIYVANSQRARVHDNHIHSMLADGIHVTNGSSTGHVSKDVTVSGNVVEGTGDDCIACVSYTTGGTAINEGISITGNVVTNGSARGITVAGGKGVAVAGNTVRNMASTSSAGIIAILDDNVSNPTFAPIDVSITGNTVGLAQGTTANTRHGIRVYRGSGVTVSGNTVAWGVGEGIKVYGTSTGPAYSDDTVVANNIVHGTGSTGENGIYCIYARRVRITGNVVIDSYKGALSLDNVIDCQVSGNIWDEANKQNVGATNLVTVATSSGVSIQNNLLRQVGNAFTHGYTTTSAGTVDYRGNTFDVTATYSGQLTSVGASTVITPGWGADVGDADVTLTAGTSAETVRYATALTANRTVTLATAGAYQGAKFRIVRSGLGAFTLNVGGLKTIPISTAAFVDVEYRASAGSWALSGYGAL
jgi:polygalacturonase